MAWIYLLIASMFEIMFADVYGPFTNEELVARASSTCMTLRGKEARGR